MSFDYIIAIDGPAASGKSTLGRLLADYLGYLYFDTGLMYRAVTFVALQRDVAIEDEEAVTRIAEQICIDVRQSSNTEKNGFEVLVDGQDVTREIRRPEVDANVSVVSAFSGVRKAMSNEQRRIGLRGKIVMIGRDIGTVILPEADLKVYLDATVEERSRRRYKDSQIRGESIALDIILESMRKRDLIDSTREVAPLKPAEDAVVINTDNLNIEQVLERVKALVEKKRL